MERLSPYVYPGLKFEGMTDRQRFILKRTGRKPVDEFIMEQVCKEYGISADEIRKRTRVRRIAYARHVYFHLCRKYTDMTLDSICGPCSGLHHTAPIHGDNKIKGLIKVDSEVRAEVGKLSNIIKQFVDLS